MTLNELMLETNKSKRALTTSYNRTVDRLKTQGIFIKRTVTDNQEYNYSIKYSDYWTQIQYKDYKIISPGHGSALLDNYNKKYNNLTLKYRTEYGDSQKSYWVCLCDCGNYTIARLDSVKNGSIVSCGCYNKKIHADNYVNHTGEKHHFIEVLELAPEEIQKQNSHRGKIWKCKCHNCGNENVYIRSDGLKNIFSCGCLKSKGEKIIIDILNQNHIRFEKEKTFKDLISKNNGYYRYDFYLPDYNCLIEYDGSQHYYNNNYFWNTEAQFEKTKESDKIKTNYALKNGYNFIRISGHLERLKIEYLLPESSIYLIKGVNDVNG